MEERVKTLKKNYKIIALTVSYLLLFVWTALGAGASLAWFSDSTPTVNNIFNFADFKIEVFHLVDDDFVKIDENTEIFDKKALYEPGYVKVVYLRIDNKGTVPFDYKTAVSVKDFNTSTNIYGGTFNLQDHMLFGLTTASTLDELKAKVATREMAAAYCDSPLGNYETDPVELKANSSEYMALIVTMPEYVDSVANHHRDAEAPWVKLRVIFTANQQK